MIHTFLPDIFIMNNHLALQERLLGLQHMLAYLDPVLSNHLVNIGITPNLYAISWLLTMFAHVLRIDLVFRVWDVLLSLSHSSSSSSRPKTTSNDQKREETCLPSLDGLAMTRVGGLPGHFVAGRDITEEVRGCK